MKSLWFCLLFLSVNLAHCIIFLFYVFLWPTLRTLDFALQAYRQCPNLFIFRFVSEHCLRSTPRLFHSSYCGLPCKVATMPDIFYFFILSRRRFLVFLSRLHFGQWQEKLTFNWTSFGQRPVSKSWSSSMFESTSDDLLLQRFSLYTGQLSCLNIVKVFKL